MVRRLQTVNQTPSLEVEEENTLPVSPVPAEVVTDSSTQRPIRLRMMAVGLAMAALVVGALVFWLFRHRYQLSPLSVKPPEQPTVTASPSPTPEPSFTVALVGYGGAGHEGAYLTDSILIAKILLEQKRIVLLSLPRDLWVQLPSGDSPPAEAKINAALAMGLSGDRLYPNRAAQFRGATGGGNALKYELQQVTGWPIDRYIGIDFAGFAKTIDALGGVDITVERAFDDYEYPIAGREDAACAHSYPLPTDVTAVGSTPQPSSPPSPVATVTPTPTDGVVLVTIEDEIVAGRLDPNQPNLLSKDVRLYPCRYEHLHFEAGKQHMDGATALKFVRSRHSTQDGTDFGRSRRQQLFLTAVLDQVFRLNFLSKIPDVYASVRSNIMTDFTAVDIAQWLSQANAIRSYPQTSLALTNQNYVELAMSGDRQSILQPLAGSFQWSDIQDWLRWRTVPWWQLSAPTVQITAPNQRRALAESVRTRLQQQTRWPILPIQTAAASPITTNNASPSARIQAVTPRVRIEAVERLQKIISEMLPTVVDDAAASAAAALNNPIAPNILIRL